MYSTEIKRRKPMTKLISCIMANYNTPAKDLKISIDSILNQTHKNFEIIIVDDKSTDDSLSFLKEYQKNHPQIKIIENKQNHGLAYSLNKAIKNAKGDYIARMDTDDIAFFDRFEKQIKYMNENPNIDVLGTFAKEFGKRKNLKMATFTKADDIKSLLLFTNALFHPTVMIRKSFLDKTKILYDPNFKTSQDYELWQRISEIGKIEVLEEILLLYRIHDGQITEKKKEMVKKYTKEISFRQLEKLGLIPNDKETIAQMVLCRIEELDEKNLDQTISWSQKIIAKNKEKKIFDHKSLNKVLNFRLFTMILRSKISKNKKLKALIKIRAINKFNTAQIIKRKNYKTYYTKNRQKIGEELEKNQ